ncbi:MAG: molybdopterin molybdotransferase MoeA [Salibacteraceae bacterium]
MISVKEAIEKVIEHTAIGKVVSTETQKTEGQYTTNDIYSPIDLPSFRNSAMDGYALLYSDYENDVRQFELAGEIPAGCTKKHKVKSGEAYRIYTGAPTPLNSDLVIMQEHVSTKNNSVIIEEQNSRKNQNIREIGEQVQKGTLALKKGTAINSATIGYLSSLGIGSINTINKPKIAVVSTGDELIEAGNSLEFGQIYESNSSALISELKKTGIESISLYKLKDDYPSTKESLSQLVKEYDYLIITGGISVGDYDFVGKALMEIDTKEIFYKVKQKPGKPLFFGKNQNCHVFALPGNPAAALSCLHIYVKTSLRKYLGCENPRPQFANLKSTSAFIKKGDRAQFLKARTTENGVEIMDGQSSNMMQTFALSNALVYVPAETSEIKIGDPVQTLLICI